MGDPGDPLSLNRYVYCGLDPVNFVDPTGFWAESAFDAMFLAMDVAELMANPTNGWAWAALAADIGCAITPGATGGRLAVKGIETAVKEAKVVKSAVKFDLQTFAKKADIKQIESIAKEFKMNPQQRRAFGDYVESLKDIVRNDTNFSYNDLKKIAKEFLED